MYKVNVHISDLFFNTQHEDCYSKDVILAEAQIFLTSLAGIADMETHLFPTPEQLVTDFYGRL